MDYPMEIEVMSSKEFIEETGFTAQEIVALTNCWRMLYAQRRKHSVDIAIKLFSKYPQYLSSFRVEHNKFDLENLHAHSRMVLDSFGFLISNLKNPTEFFGLLQRMSETHKDKFVSNNNMSISLDVVKKHIIETLKNIMSPTLEAGLDKLCDTIELHHLHEYHGVERRTTVMSFKNAMNDDDDD